MNDPYKTPEAEFTSNKPRLSKGTVVTTLILLVITGALVSVCLVFMFLAVDEPAPPVKIPIQSQVKP